MKIPEIPKLQMIGTLPGHMVPEKKYNAAEISFNKISSLSSESATVEKNNSSFESYLIDAMKTVNDYHLQVSALSQQAIVDPDSVTPHDITIAMNKANTSLQIAKNVIDRLIQGWNEITTTR